MYPPFKENWMDRWFMVFEKPPCNNREVPLYFLRKLWAEFMLGHHVNFLDIGELWGCVLVPERDYKNNTLYHKFLRNFLPKCILSLFIVEVVRRGGRMEVFAEFIFTCVHIRIIHTSENNKMTPQCLIVQKY
jgi:hypothetical protein